MLLFVKIKSQKKPNMQNAKITEDGKIICYTIQQIYFLNV